MYRYLASQPETNKYQRKAAVVNRYLKGRSREKNLHFINHGNTITVRHLNTSKLHLIKRGTQVLSSQFAEAIMYLQSVLHSLANNGSFNSTPGTDEYKAKGKQLIGENLKAIHKEI